MLDDSKEVVQMLYKDTGYDRLLLSPPAESCRNVVDSLLAMKHHKVCGRPPRPRAAGAAVASWWCQLADA